MAVALACSEDDWPHDDWPRPEDPFWVRLFPPPYDGLRRDPRNAPDVVVLRCDDSLEAFPQLLDAMGERSTPVIVLSPAWEETQVVDLLRLGAVGYLVDGDYCTCMLNAAIAG